MDFGKPYTNIKETQEYIIREFNNNINPIELMWHRDLEDRIIESIGNTNWKIQLENQLPILINKPIFIPAYMWHRVIKGTDLLKIIIYKI
jgi:hypothetical protein